MRRIVLLAMLFAIAGCGSGATKGAQIAPFKDSDLTDCISVTMDYVNYEQYNGIYCRANLEIP